MTGDCRLAYTAQRRGLRTPGRHRCEDEDSARQVGIDAKTLLRWLKIPEFQAAYLAARRTAYSQAVARLQQGTSAAATTLLKTMIDPSTPASVRVRAAEAIFNHAAKAIEIEDIDARLAAVEQAQENQKR